MTRSRRGSAVRQTSTVSGQRGANGHPGGSSVSAGGAPSIAVSASSRAPSTRGIAPSSPDRVGHPRRGEQALDAGLLDDPAGVHDGHPVGEAGQQGEVVADHQDRRAGEVPRAAQDLEHLRLNRHVERRRRLVGHDHVGLLRDRDRDHHPLPLPAGDLVRVGAGTRARVGDADDVEQLDGALARRLAAEPGVRADCLGHLVADRVDRRQRRLRVLEDDRDAAAAHGRELCRRRARSAPGRRAAREPLTLAVAGSSPVMASAVADLPQPDSPASPSTSPRARSRSIPRTACTSPASPA